MAEIFYWFLGAEVAPIALLFLIAFGLFLYILYRCIRAKASN